MTRSVAIALSTFGAASIACASEMQSVPEPSFVDYPVMQASEASPGLSASSGGSRSFEVSDMEQPLPAPSFLDTGTPAWDQWHAGAPRRGVIEVSAAPTERLPTPSFLY
jgi:hypothetical protein